VNVGDISRASVASRLDARHVELVDRCGHPDVELTAKRDDSNVGGSGVVYYPRCNSCGADVPAAS
jgi:hypothetical protein